MKSLWARIPGWVKVGSALTLGFVLVLVAMGVYSALSGPAAPPKGPSEDEIRADVAAICRNQVSRSLKAPSTAKFRDSRVQAVGTGVGLAYRITGSVDAENSFGAMIRNTYECESERTESGALVTKLVRLG